MTDNVSNSVPSKIAHLIKLDIESLVPVKHYFEDNEIYVIALEYLLQMHSTIDDGSWVKFSIDEIMYQELMKNDSNLLVTRDEAKLVLSKFRDRLTQKMIYTVNQKLTHQEVSQIFAAVDSRNFHLVSRQVNFMYLAKYGLPVVDDFTSLEKKPEVTMVSDCVYAMIPGVGNDLNQDSSWGCPISINGQMISFPDIFHKLKASESYMIDPDTDPEPIISGAVLHCTEEGWRTVHINVFEEWDTGEPYSKTQIFLHDEGLLILSNVAVEMHLDLNFYEDMTSGSNLPEDEDEWDEIDLSRIGRFTCNLVVSRHGKLSLLIDPVKPAWVNSSVEKTLNFRKAMIESVNRRLSKINAWL